MQGAITCRLLAENLWLCVLNFKLEMTDCATQDSCGNSVGAEFISLTWTLLKPQIYY
jgi:hypothetical protein